MTEDEKLLLNVAKIEAALDKKLQRRPNSLVQIMNFVGGVSGLLALAALIAYGGEMHRQLTVDSRRIDVIEANGSPVSREQVKALLNESESRREADIVINNRITDLRLEYSQRIGNIVTLMEKETEQQTQLIALIKAQNQVTQKP